jgi:DNA-binding transcriptional regulator YiaG
MTDDGLYELPRRRPPPRTWDAAQIAALRARLLLTQAAFASRLGVRQQTVSEWETGQYAPRGASAKLLGMLAEESAGYPASSPD